MSQARQLIASAGLLASVRVVGMMATFLVTVALARVLGADSLGFYAFVVVVLGFLNIPVGVGLGIVLLRTVAGGKHSADWGSTIGLMRTGVGIALIFSVGVLVIGLAAQQAGFSWWPTLLEPHIIAILVTVLFLDQIAGLRLASLRGLGHPVWGQSPEMLVRPLVLLLVFLALVSLFPAPSLEHAFAALLTGSLVAAFIGIVVLNRKIPPELGRATPSYQMRKWAISGIVISSNSGLNALVIQLDLLLLGWLGTFDQVGVYRVAMQIAAFGGFAYSALSFIAMDRFARAFGAGDTTELRRLASLLSRVALLFTLPFPVLSLLGGEAFLQYVFGPEFGAAIGPLMLLLGVQAITAFFGMASGLLMMSGNENRLVGLTGIAVVVNCALCLALIPSLGPLGAALSSLISVGGLRLAVWAVAYRTLGIDASAMGLPPRIR